MVMIKSNFYFSVTDLLQIPDKYKQIELYNYIGRKTDWTIIFISVYKYYGTSYTRPFDHK